jgi:internalin A
VADLAPLANLQSLQSLDFSVTQVADLAPLANILSLQFFDCSDTQVADLAPLANLQALQSLHCSDTQVADLAPLTNLQSLKSLNCSDTQVADLAPLAKLQSLQLFDCSDTQVADLAPLANLQALQSLYCSSTQVADLAPLLRLEKLGELHADACHLHDLPKRLIAKLSKLYLHEASVPSIPGEVLSHNTSEDCLPRLRAHLADLEAGSVEIRRAKLVVLGNGRVGKTQLCRQLQGLPYDPSVPSTHGICVSNLACAALGPGEELNLWDFGGQDIYHGTHALFMRTRALFVIVWHPEFEQAAEESQDGIRFRNYPLAYWLDYVRTLGHAQSPVIVVQSRCDHAALEARRLPADSDGIPFLKQCWHSAKTGYGKEALVEAIRYGVLCLREREGVSEIGKGRARVIEILEGWRNEDAGRPREERQHRTLSQAQFRQLCENGGGISSPDSLLDYLHQLGVVFYQPGLFLDAIILDQSWALEAVYAVFEREKSYRQIASMGGRFTRSLLDMTVWGDYSPREQALFLSLMESAGVCFVRRKADPKLDLEAEYVAPDLLPDKAAVADQLSGRWSDGEGAHIEFHYPFLHTGLVRGLICDAGKLAGDNGVYWKYGVWVYDRDSGARALIEMRSSGQHGGSVAAWVQQGRPERLARWIRERFAEQNRRFGYPDLKPVIDELPRVDERTADKSEAALPPRLGDGPEGCGKLARPAAPAEPAFGPIPATDFARQGAELFISYAWGDDTEEGQRRAAAVDSICSALAAKNIDIHRDKADLSSGDRIREFMDRLIEGDLIVAVLSDKYLRSPFCMYELFGIFRRCRDQAEGFLAHVIPIVLPDAKIGRAVDRLKYAAFWKQERDELEQATRGLDDVAYAGVEIIKEYRLVDEFARNVADMLAYLNDKLMPRDLTRMERDSFAEIVRLIGKGGKP